MLRNTDKIGLGEDRDPEMEQILLNLMEKQAKEGALSDDTDRIRDLINDLMDSAGPEADSGKLVEICTLAFDATEKKNFEGSPSDMRRHIEELIDIDTRVALGAVISMTIDAYNSDNFVSMQHKSAVCARTQDLVTLIHDTCKGDSRDSGLARLRVTLRYMLEKHYDQNTSPIEALCNGPLSFVDIESAKSVMWDLSEHLKYGDTAFDLGCGPGKSIGVLEEKVGEGNVIGVDINPIFAMGNEHIDIGVIDENQRTISGMCDGNIRLLSLEDHFGTGSFALESLVSDRVADQSGLYLLGKQVLKPGGFLGICLRLPVNCSDDEPDLEHRIKYVVNKITTGEDGNADLTIIVRHLQDLGFDQVLFRHMPIEDPVSGNTYNDHYTIIARRGQ
ncbi:MAG: hypothetical protein K9M03_04015 [Kiritimatiellales bacterium]|nr:hypothetical protein [Kiritimatiellales bacterium]